MSSWLLFGVLLLGRSLADVCHPKHFHELRGNEDDDYILYGLTQDCQIFFIRPAQISLLSTLNINIHSSYCNPNLAQLHLKSHDTLLLLLKQAGNRICTIELQIPPAEMLFGDHLFRYSILASLSYASCSHSSDNQLALESDLSFLDSVYSNILYFIDGNSGGLVWDTLQFLVTDDGHLRLLDKIPINNYAKHDWNGPDLANEYVIGLDAQRNYLYQRNRFENNYVYSCAFDLMFRPNKVSVHNGTTSSRQFRTWLNSLSADGSLHIYTETDRTIQPPVTRIFGQNVSSPNKETKCLGITNFAFELGIVRSETLRKMKANPLPEFGGVESTTRQTTNPWKITRLGSSTTTRRTTTTRKATVRATTLKSTTVGYKTSDGVVTRTRFEETTTPEYEEYDEEEETTTDGVTPVPLATDASDLPLGFITDNASLRNTTQSMSADQSKTTAIASITVSLLVLICHIFY